MQKRRFMFIFLWLAYAIVFGHSVIPHHHHENVEVSRGHQDKHDDEHNDIDDNFLGKALANFQHGQVSNQLLYISYSNQAASYRNNNICRDFILPTYFQFTEIHSPLLIN